MKRQQNKGGERRRNETEAQGQGFKAHRRDQFELKDRLQVITGGKTRWERGGGVRSKNIHKASTRQMRNSITVSK